MPYGKGKKKRKGKSLHMERGCTQIVCYPGVGQAFAYSWKEKKRFSKVRKRGYL